MRIAKGAGPYWDIVEAPSPTDPSKLVKFGVKQDAFQRLRDSGWATPVAQYYGIVQEGLCFTEHVFSGLQRPLAYSGNLRADQDILIHSWRPGVDYTWAGSPQHGSPKQMAPPLRRVFVVLVRKIEPDEFGVEGVIEHWNWVEEDSGLRYAPINWDSRYARKIWSKEEHHS